MNRLDIWNELDWQFEDKGIEWLDPDDAQRLADGAYDLDACCAKRRKECYHGYHDYQDCG